MHKNSNSEAHSSETLEYTSSEGSIYYTTYSKSRAISCIGVVFPKGKDSIGPAVRMWEVVVVDCEGKRLSSVESEK